jgi:hypothetical protein
VRIISPEVMKLFDRERNAEWQANGDANTPLGLYTGVDFRLVATRLVLQEPFSSQRTAGELDDETLRRLLASQNNVGDEWQLELEVVKPAR